MIVTTLEATAAEPVGLAEAKEFLPIADLASPQPAYPFLVFVRRDRRSRGLAPDTARRVKRAAAEQAGQRELGREECEWDCMVQFWPRLHQSCVEARKTADDQPGSAADDRKCASQLREVVTPARIGAEIPAMDLLALSQDKPDPHHCCQDPGNEPCPAQRRKAVGIDQNDAWRFTGLCVRRTGQAERQGQPGEEEKKACAGNNAQASCPTILHAPRPDRPSGWHNNVKDRLLAARRMFR